MSVTPASGRHSVTSRTREARSARTPMLPVSKLTPMRQTWLVFVSGVAGFLGLNGTSPLYHATKEDPQADGRHAGGGAGRQGGNVARHGQADDPA